MTHKFIDYDGTSYRRLLNLAVCLLHQIHATIKRNRDVHVLVLCSSNASISHIFH